MRSFRLTVLLVIFLALFVSCSKQISIGKFGGVNRAIEVAFLPDGEHLVTGEDQSRQGTSRKVEITVFDGLTFQPQSLGSYQGSIEALTISADGKYIAAASNEDKTIRLWNLQSRQMLTVGEGIYPRGLVFTSDGKQLISSGLGEIRIWNVENRQMRVLYNCSGSTNADHLLAISQDGNKIVTPCKSDDKGIIKLIDVKTGEAQTIKTTDISTDVRQIALSPDGKSLALTVSNSAIRNMEARSIRLVNIQTGEMKILGESEGEIETYTFSPDNKSLASGDSGKIRVWDIESGRNRIVGACDDSVMSLSFSPNGKNLAAACNYKGFQIIKL